VWKVRAGNSKRTLLEGGKVGKGKGGEGGGQKKLSTGTMEDFLSPPTQSEDITGRGNKWVARGESGGGIYLLTPVYKEGRPASEVKGKRIRVTRSTIGTNGGC